MNRQGVLGTVLAGILILFALGFAFAEEVEDEVFILVREKELLAFSAIGNRWVKQELRPKEQVLASKYGGKVAVVFTKFRVLGFSAHTNKWREKKLMIDEAMVAIEAKGNVGTIITTARALGFSARTGVWIAERFGVQ